MPSSNIIDQSRPTLLYYSTASYVHSTSQIDIDLLLHLIAFKLIWFYPLMEYEGSLIQKIIINKKKRTIVSGGTS